MNINKLKVLIILMLLIVFAVSVFARTYVETGADKKFDTTQVHNLGNIWLRMSNYGYFGSGGEGWPSLEYPGGSSIDYLFYGGLWFGAKKVRRDQLGRPYYWLDYDEPDEVVLYGDSLWSDSLQVVVDTLVSIGIDGYFGLNELLPAYNPLEISYLGSQYTAHNYQDKIITTSIRDQRKGIDDDGDGFIDEDPVGYAFPFIPSEFFIDEASVFSIYGGDWLHNSEIAYGTDIITNEANQAIWFPLGFVDLSDNTNTLYNFSEPNDDDGDGITDEDGYPVSEQDFISYYYDYSPFENGNPDPDRDYSSSAGSNRHVPLNIRVRQMSYQWSYDYIKNLVYIEFDITNMNAQDTLIDCAMGIYMDSDVGPQSFGGTAIAPDDISSYIKGEGYEFAYTYDADKDGGLTTGYVGSRVCTPDPEQLVFSCWTYDLDNTGPDDWDPLNYATIPTANEKYWLLTGRNPNEEFFIDIREDPDYQINNTPGGTDTRYLFGFYGAQAHTGDIDGNGIDDYLEIDDDGVYFKRWNLPPDRTMKIVIAVFPGESIVELKRTAEFAKFIYGEPQTLTTVVLPDIALHYEAPEPPDYPNMYAGLINDGNAIEIYWDNISEFTTDIGNIPQSVVGWQEDIPGIDSYAVGIDSTYMPEEYWPYTYGISENPENAIVNPWTAYRLRHDFQGYALYGRSGSGSQEDWVEKGKWDKYETYQDILDYQVNYSDTSFVDYQGEIGIGTYDQSLPNRRLITEEDENYYHLNEYYGLIPFEFDPNNPEYTFGNHIYDYTKTRATALEESGLESWSDNDKALYFANPDILALPNGDDVYLELYSRSLIPLSGFISDNIFLDPNSAEIIEEIRIKRLSRRYYYGVISHPRKGIEYYVAVTAWDRGMPSQNVPSNESGKDAEANMRILFPGPSAKTDMDNIYVIPNPYIGQSKFDGRREDDFTGDRSRRIWFVNLPENCTIKIYTLAGDLVDKVVHHGSEGEDIITVGAALNKDKLKQSDITATGMASWDLLSHNNQIIAAGVYLFSVKDHDSGNIKVGKFVIIK